MVTGLRGLRSRLLEVREYLEAVSQGRLPVNHDILRNLQARPAGGWGRGGGRLGDISCAEWAAGVQQLLGLLAAALALPDWLSERHHSSLLNLTPSPHPFPSPACPPAGHLQPAAQPERG